MPVELEISLLPKDANDHHSILGALRSSSALKDKIAHYRVVRRSIDARNRQVKYVLKVEAYQEEEEIPANYIPHEYRYVSNGARILIIGAGPAGLFAALKCLELGLKPIIIERGKNVQQRRRDLAAINRDHIVDQDSNYCFGEGGAGTYSDGKLYTRSTKRGDVRSVLETLVHFGASEDILIDAHPHIGTNKLPKIISAISDLIVERGGEIHFNTRMVDFHLERNRIDSVITSTGESIGGEAVILATGHSARDVFELLQRKNIEIEFKPFALGVRAEHPQIVIDKVQYHCDIRPDELPPASYSLVHQVKGRGVYSFCMCPGGIIAPCATAQVEVVTNGWSPSKRNNPWANSGIVVPVQWEDLGDFKKHGALAGLYFQKEIEHTCWIEGGKTQVVPAQRLVDFTKNKRSTSLPDCSYQPGIHSSNLNEILPDFIGYHLREGFLAFGNKMKGYLTNDAVLVAPESRTSSPVRIPRHKENLRHPQVENLFPCAEGAGYAGGIISAAIDGENVASMIAEALLTQ